MNITEILSLLFLLLTVAGMMVGQWRALQSQRDADREATRIMIDALRAHTDMEIGALHERVNRAETKEEANIRESRLSQTLVRLESKLDRLIERKLGGPI